MKTRVRRHPMRTRRGRMTIRAEHGRELSKGIQLVAKTPTGQTVSFHPEDEQEAKDLTEWIEGKAKQGEGKVTVAPYLKRDHSLLPSLEAEFDRLRTILEHEVEFGNTHILLDYNTRYPDPKYPWNDVRSAEIAGFTDPYKGTTWAVRLTPSYTVQNQKEIAEYLRRNEDAIVEAVKRLAPRQRHSANWLVKFYEDHPGLTVRRFINPGPGEERGHMEEAHPETG